MRVICGAHFRSHHLLSIFGRFFTGRLWGHPDFLKLWAGQTISIVGSGVTASALPLTAVLVLGASASSLAWGPSRSTRASPPTSSTAG